MRTVGTAKSANAPNRPIRPDIFVYGAALISMGALAVTALGLPLLALFAIAILASIFINVRLEEGTALRWLPRVLLIVLIYIATPDTGAVFDGILPVRVRDIFGELCAAEMVVQFYRRRSYDPYRSSLIILLMSGLTFLNASNTSHDDYIRYLTPLYLICVAFMARDYRPRRAFEAPDRQTPDRKRQERKKQFVALLLRMTAAAAALLIGLVGCVVTTANKGRLTDLGNQAFLRPSWAEDTSGMMSQPILGSLFGQQGSTLRVLRMTPFAGDPHECGTFYDLYENGRWSPPVRNRTPKALSLDTLRLPKTLANASAFTSMHVTRLVNDMALIYMPLSTAALDTSDEGTFNRFVETGSPITTARARAPFEYIVTVSPQDDYQGIFAQKLLPAERDICLRTPTDQDEPDLEPVRNLAEHIAGNLPTASAKAAAITAYLLRTHRYSLEFHPSSTIHDPIADFLLSTPAKGAHCVFFASAAALLLRYVHVPTRYVTGYYAHEHDGTDVIVRQSDAHAWCQAWIAGQGWVTVDATPSDGRPDELVRDNPVPSWRKAWEWIQDTAKAFADALANITPVQMGVALGALTAVSLLVLAVRFYLRKRTQSDFREDTSGYTSRDASLESLGQKFEMLWRRRMGEAFPANRSYSDYLQQLTRIDYERDAKDGPFVERAGAFARLYEVIRFGGRQDNATRDALQNTLEAMEANNTE